MYIPPTPPSIIAQLSFHLVLDSLPDGYVGVSEMPQYKVEGQTLEGMLHFLLYVNPANVLL